MSADKKDDDCTSSPDIDAAVLLPNVSSLEDYSTVGDTQSQAGQGKMNGGGNGGGVSRHKDLDDDDDDSIIVKKGKKEKHGDVEMGTSNHNKHVTMDDNLDDDDIYVRHGSNRSARNFFPNSLRSDVKIDLDRLPRLVLRNRAFHQSSNKVHIRHNQGARIYKLLRYNWFHVFLRWPTRYSLLALMSVWTGAILIFAAIYIWHDKGGNHAEICGLGGFSTTENGESEFVPITFAAAFAFSLETCTTVGYGLPNGVNSYFERGCGGLQIIIYLQMAWSMLFNAFLITFLYSRLGRSETRSTQVIYSDKALVSKVDGQVRFQVRLFDCDAKHPVVEAHVRFYCVLKHRPVPRPLRLLQPDDELGGMLFLSFPSVVNHNIDLYSLLHPPIATTVSTVKPKGLVLRQVDGKTSGRDDVICPVCGESYGTFKRWRNHVRYQQIVESKDEYPMDGTHLSIDLEEVTNLPGTNPITNLEILEEYFKKNVSEILCVVEGIDPMQSGTFQALQSYRYEDIVWEPHSQFAPCLTVVDKAMTKGQTIYTVDLDRYHDIVSDPEAEAAAAEEAAYLKAEAERIKEEKRNAEILKKEKKIGSNGVAAEKDANPVPEQKPAATVRKRHRRVKTLSNRTSDSLFTLDQPCPAITAVKAELDAAAQAV